MSGTKGKSGGARANAGGARPGAGRKSKAGPAKSANHAPKTSKTGAPRKPAAKPGQVEGAHRPAKKESLEQQAHGGALKRTKAVPVPMGDRDVLTMLQDVALGRVEATAAQIRAACGALPFLYAKKGEGGKKEEQADKAKRAASKFVALSPPARLVVNNKDKK
ncbi:hypothetical protein WN982_00330 [Paraburkholderia sp. IMGN_8]|uniref:hypothetical protein n=1 Tax=Paraburkholderia sp. IMGN_8 TaxID=3136564 RepID=UPI003100B4A5